MAFSPKITIIKQQMLEIIFVSSFFFVSNFYTVKIPDPSPYFYSISGILKNYKNEYIMICSGVLIPNSYAYKLKIKYDNITIIDEKFLGGYPESSVEYLMIFENNAIIYSFMSHAYVDNNEKTNEIEWRGIIYSNIKRFKTETFLDDCLLICTWTYNYSPNSYPSMEDRYDYQLHLIKPPYTEINKEIEIETFTKDDDPQLIGLKDYYVFIKIDEGEYDKKNITYKFIDYDLNLVNSLTKEYENYSEIYYYTIPNDDEVNKFVMCFLKDEDILDNLVIYKCQIIAYENKDLQIIQTIDIPISYKYGLYHNKIILFDENKIGFLVNDYINVIQYENQVLSFYKNFKNITIQTIVTITSNTDLVQLTMTEQGPAIIVNYYFYYLSSICVPKTIILYANQLEEFPIEEFIFPGVEPIRFSFEEISDFITIYKNSAEIKKGQVFYDLEILLIF